MRLTILLLLSLGLTACQDDGRIERKGDLNCELVLMTEPRLVSGFVEDVLAVGEELGLERTADSDTEAAFSERTHPVHIKYLVKQIGQENGLVALVTNAPATDKVLIQIYDGAASPSTIDALRMRLIRIAKPYGELEIRSGQAAP